MGLSILVHRCRFAAPLALLGIVACAGASSPPPAQPGGSAQTQTQARQAKPWNDMSHQERGQYMGEVVLPRMRQLFQSFDATRFAVVNCRTCHGQGAEDHSFQMPDTELARLPDNAAGFQALAREKPQWMRFMAEQVRPQMAALLGKEEVDMRNPKPDAFGCRNCHVLTGPAPTGG